jgi:hypothetical protein
MARFANKLAFLSLCGAFILSHPSLAQNANEEAPAGSSLPEQANPAPAANDAGQPATAAPQQLGQSTEAEAKHSAEATAHKSLTDPNNQLGTSLQGRTRPVAGAAAGPPYDTASTAKPAEADTAATAKPAEAEDR